MSPTHRPTRRHFLLRSSRLGAAAAAAWPMITTPSRAAARAPRSLAFAHTHTGERVELMFAVGESYLPEALATLDRFLRDHYTGEVGRIEPQLFDQLHRVQQALGGTGAFEVISGYRGPATNERLRTQGGGGVARHSLHLEGRAIDVRLAGVALADLRDAALALRVGGVGYYPGQRFVHLDTGRVRSW